jgi:hypothetical protein
MVDVLDVLQFELYYRYETYKQIEMLVNSIWRGITWEPSGMQICNGSHHLQFCDVLEHILSS